MEYTYMFSFCLLVFFLLAAFLVESSNCSDIDGILPTLNPESKVNDKIVENHSSAENSSTKKTDNNDDTNMPEWDHPKYRRFGTLHTLEKLVYWANKEEMISNVLKERLAKIQNEIDFIAKYMIDYEESSGKALRAMINPSEDPKVRGEVIGSSAVLGHLMTFRYASIVDPFRKYLKSKDYRLVRENTQKILQINSTQKNDTSFSEQWPNEDDLYTAHISILKMNEVYGFRPEQFYRGITSDTNFGGQLKAEHCANIGIAALKQMQYYMAIEWFELAQSLILVNSDASISKDVVTTMLDKAIAEHNALLLTNQSSSLDFYVNPTYAGEPNDKRLRRRPAYYAHFSGFKGNQSNVLANFLGLCSGQDYQPQHIKATLYCFLQRNFHPYFVLNPVKVEQLSHSPYIVQMYDILGNETMNQLYKVRGEMILVGVAAATHAVDILPFRSSSGAALKDDDEFTIKIRRLTERVTGLVFANVYEQLQTVEYTYGRYYGYHSDVISKRKGMVEEPEIGGSTVFCEVGTFARTVRGSAIFWYVCKNYSNSSSTAE
ncbi:unnamed protein product [Orchesella dallaii]|uniref:Uncharacterized protein n=1 Tax=Orchesella dallaii TaxID=48710 RepID=A0ABP1Q974_9HEXA